MTTARTSYGLGVALTVATTLLLVLGIGALGIVGDGGRADRIFLAVPVVLLLGVALSRLRAGAMALALAATALTQLAAAALAVVAVAAGVQDFAGASIADIVMVDVMYAGLFAVSSWLFLRADRLGSAAGLRGGSPVTDGARS